MRFSYDADGNLVSATDLAGATWAYTYTERITNLPHDIASFPQDKQDDLYAAQGKLLLTEIRDPLGHIVERQHYNTNGCAVEQRNGEDQLIVALEYPEGEDCSPGKQRILRDGLGNTQTHSYSAAGELVDQTIEFAYNGSTKSTHEFFDTKQRIGLLIDANGNESRQVWDATGANLHVVIDPLQQWTTYDYDSHNNLTQLTNTDNQATKYEYSDPRFPTLPTRMIDAQQNTTVYSYTLDGQLQEEVVYLKGIHGQAPIVHVYDSLGQRIRTVKNFGGGDPATVSYNASSPDQDIVTEYGYDALGRVVTVAESVAAMLDRTTSFEYDAIGHLIRVTHSFEGQQVSMTYIYDAAGNLLLMRDPLGRENWTCYDAANRPRRRVQNYQPAGPLPDPGPCNLNQSLSGAADTNITTDLDYDVGGNQAMMIDPLGRKTFVAYDSLRRPVTIVGSAKDAATIALNPGDPGYSAANDPRSGSYAPLDPTTFPDRDRITRMSYDPVGNLLTVQDPDGRRVRTCYDTLGRQVLSIVNPAGQRAQPDVGCDALVSGAGLPAPSADADKDIIALTTYDRMSRTQSASDPLGRVSHFDYDALGRLARAISNYQGQGDFNPAAPDVNITQATTYDQLPGGWGQGLQTVDVSTTFADAHDPQARSLHTLAVIDPLGRQKYQIRNFKDGNFDSAQPSEDLTTSFTYNGADQVIAAIDSAYDGPARSTTTSWATRAGACATSSAAPTMAPTPIGPTRTSSPRRATIGWGGWSSTPTRLAG